MNTHDIELPKPFTTAYDDVDKVEVGCYSEIQVRAAIETDRQSRNCGQCVPLSADGTAVFIDGVGDVPLDFSGQESGDLISAYQEKIRALEAENHALISELDDRQARGEPAFYVNARILDSVTGKIKTDVNDPLTWSEKPVGNWQVPVYTAPQPAEPIPPNSMELENRAEPMKVPSEELTEFMSQFADGFDIPPYRFAEAARALLARYGQPADPIGAPTLHNPNKSPTATSRSVPEPLKYGGAWKDHYVTGWNNCRAAMFEAAPEVKDK